MKGECAQIRQDLSACIDRELPPERLKEVAAHLRACKACAAEFRALRAAARAVRALPAVAPPADFLDRVTRRIAVPEPKARRILRLRVLWPAAAAAAVALIIALLTPGRQPAAKHLDVARRAEAVPELDRAAAALDETPEERRDFAAIRVKGADDPSAPRAARPHTTESGDVSLKTPSKPSSSGESLYATADKSIQEKREEVNRFAKKNGLALRRREGSADALQRDALKARAEGRAQRKAGTGAAATRGARASVAPKTLAAVPDEALTREKPKSVKPRAPSLRLGGRRVWTPLRGPAPRKEVVLRARHIKAEMDRVRRALKQFGLSIVPQAKSDRLRTFVPPDKYDALLAELQRKPEKKAEAVGRDEVVEEKEAKKPAAKPERARASAGPRIQLIIIFRSAGNAEPATEAKAK